MSIQDRLGYPSPIYYILNLLAFRLDLLHILHQQHCTLYSMLNKIHQIHPRSDRNHLLGHKSHLHQNMLFMHILSRLDHPIQHKDYQGLAQIILLLHIFLIIQYNLYNKNHNFHCLAMCGKDHRLVYRHLIRKTIF